MAATVSEGLSALSKADLSGLSSRIQALRAEAEKALKLGTDPQAADSIEALLSALEKAKRSSA